ncbi:VOC family protein [Streptosporangium soli]|nr:hypothetical protein [Streptosporangium sp. KLBMP 9127]
MTVEDTQGHHLAFTVDPATFDAIPGRLRERGVPYGSEPWAPDNGRIDHPRARAGCSSQTWPGTSTRSCRRSEDASGMGGGAFGRRRPRVPVCGEFDYQKSR